MADERLGEAKFSSRVPTLKWISLASGKSRAFEFNWRWRIALGSLSVKLREPTNSNLSGPLATSVDDLDLLVGFQRGYLPGDPDTAPGVGDVVREVPKRIVAMDRLSGETPLPDEVRILFRDAVDTVARTYELDVTWHGPGAIFQGHDPIRDWMALATAEHVNALSRDFVAQQLDDMHLSVQQFLSYGLGVSVDEYISARRRRFACVRILD